MPHDFLLIALVISIGCYMAWSIGANDVANAMGTSVGSRALTLRQAVVIAAILEFSGAFLFGSDVSETVQKGIIDISFFANEPRVLAYGMLAALTAAGMWLQIASYYGWPVSTTHTIVGAIVGFGLIYGGNEVIHWGNVAFIVASWLLSPLCGGVIAFLIFSFLRSNIFYSHSPLQATKKITPMLLFFFFVVFTMVLLFNGLENLNLQFSFWETVFLSCAIGALGSFFGSLFLLWNSQKLLAEPSSDGDDEDSHIPMEIEMAKGQLKQLRTELSGEMDYRLGEILEKVDSFEHSLQREKRSYTPLPVASQYRAVEKIFGYLQVMSACLMAFSHGANDVANAIGPLAAAIMILKSGVVSETAPIELWMLALGGVGIVVGLATWGWRVIETIGRKITELTPTRGFAAEFGAAFTILVASRLGMPISTTHTLVGAVLGVGLAGGIGALNLAMTRDIFISWFVTVPSGAAITVCFFYLFQFLFG